MAVKIHWWTIVCNEYCAFWQVSQQPYLHLVIGNHDLKKFDVYERRFRIESIVMHPDFRRKGPYSNDISIIKVASNNDAGISFNTHVKPICLPKHTDGLKPGTWCSVTGWGAQIRKLPSSSYMHEKLTSTFFNWSFVFVS